MPTLDTAALTNRLAHLKFEHRAVSIRKVEIEQEIRDIMGRIEAELRPDGIRSDARKPTVTRPRPVEDKLGIAAGRIVVRGVKAGWDRDRIKAEAIERAKQVARKYGLKEVSGVVIRRIDGSINKHLRLV